jgi:hypothetical protein
MTMTTRQLTKRALTALALAAAAFTPGSAAARDPVITIVSGQANDPTTLNAAQSETACAVSVFPSDKRQIEVIAANDDTTSSGFFYNDTNRAATVGASQMGWYFRERTTANPSPPWQHGRIVPGSGNAADIDVLWGDPGVAAAPDAPNLMLMGSLVVPHAKFGPNKCPDGTPCISGAVGSSDGCSPLGGACVARSLDGGKTFTMQHCFRDVTPGSCKKGDSNDSTLGHFYDGFDVAIGSGTTPPAAVAVRDVDTSKEALWMMTNGVTDPTFTFVDTNTGPMGALGDDRQEISIHVRLRYDSGNQLWRMSPDSESIMVGTNQVAVSILKVNILGRNAPAKAIASDYKIGTLGAARVNGVPTGANDPDGKLQATVRFGPQFDFDVGVNENGGNEMRFAYMATDATGLSYIQAGFCSFDLTTCGTPKEWRSSLNASVRHFHPAIKYGFDPRGNRHMWKVTYYELTPDGQRVAVIATDLLRNGAGQLGATPFNPVAVVDASYQAPCPDSRGTPSTDPTKATVDANDYWGDYDDMLFNPQQCAFVRSFTDSHLGCVNRRGFTATHQHVSAVEIPCPFDPQSRRSVEFDYTLWINDDDFGPFDEDECKTWGAPRSGCDNDPLRKHAKCEVDADNRELAEHTIFEECINSEVRGQVNMKCALLDDDRTVRVTMNPRLWEGTSCGGANFKLEGPFSFDVATDVPATIPFPVFVSSQTFPTNGPPYDRVEINFPDPIANVAQP